MSDSNVIIDTEIWKDVAGYEAKYRVSNFGRVLSLPNRTRICEKILIPYLMDNGYLQVQLCKEGKAKKFLVHRLVALAFIANPNNKPEVNHLDTYKSNNVVSNLEWATPKENSGHYSKLGILSRKGMKGPSSKLTDEQVFEIREHLKEGVLSQRQIGKMFGVANNTICSINTRTTWDHI